MAQQQIRIALPHHLRTIARLEEEAAVEAQGATLADALDALEARYPALGGTIRDHVTKKRRPFIRFFACGQDLSLLDPFTTTLPEEVLNGREALYVVGAIAGGAS